MKFEFEKEFRAAHPETIGETDREFDSYNYMLWLEQQLKNCNLQNVSISFLSDVKRDMIVKQIGLLAEKQGGIIGITALQKLPKWLNDFLNEIAADYGRQIDFLKSVLANEH